MKNFITVIANRKQVNTQKTYLNFPLCIYRTHSQMIAQTSAQMNYMFPERFFVTLKYFEDLTQVTSTEAKHEQHRKYK